MTVLRAYSVGLQNAAPSKVRVYRAFLEAVVDPVARLRVHRASLDGTPATVLLPHDPVSLGPGEEKTVTMQTEDGVPATGWTWRRISGPSLSMSGSGGTRKLTGPHLWNQYTTQPLGSPPAPAVTEVGVQAVRDGIISDEVVIVVTTFPQSAWTRTGSTWKGARNAVA